MVFARPPDTDGRPHLSLLEYRQGPINSSRVLDVAADMRPTRTEELLQALASWAERTSVLITAEALARPFWRKDEDFLARLELLAGDHEVKVGYYVRPQDSSLESGWRQWGFRIAGRPSGYVNSRSRQLHYYDTRHAVRRLAPRVDFIVRPFVVDLLDDNDVATDFAWHVLGLPGFEATGEPVRENTGLPIQMINLLRMAPKGWFWESPDDNSRLDLVKQICAPIEWPPDEQSAEALDVLRAYAVATFEKGNQQLIAELGWPVETFVTPPVRPVPTGPPATERAVVDRTDPRADPPAEHPPRGGRLAAPPGNLTLAPRADRVPLGLSLQW